MKNYPFTGIVDMAIFFEKYLGKIMVLIGFLIGYMTFLGIYSCLPGFYAFLKRKTEDF